MDDPDSDANPAPLQKRLFFLFLHVLREWSFAPHHASLIQKFLQKNRSE